MNHEEQVGKNFAWSAMSQFIIRIFGLVFFVFMSHILLEKGMGQYNFITSFVSFWFVFSDFGIGNYLYREWSAGDILLEKIKYDFNLIFTLKIATATVIFVPFCIVNWFINKDVLLALILYYVFVILSLIISQTETYLASVNNFKLAAIRALLEKFVMILVGGVLLILYRNVEVVFVAMILSQIVSIFYYFLGRFPFMPKLLFDWYRTKELAIKGLPFVVGGVFLSIYGRIDIVMLKFMQTFESVGWYSAGYKAYELANIFPGVLFLPAIFPVLSRIFNSESREKYKYFFDRSLRILFISGLFLSIFFVVFAPYIISLFFPSSFGPSVLAMRIIVLVLVISSFSSVFYTMLIIQKREKLSLKIIAVSCLTNIILNVILIPKYSLYGAAWATVIAEMLNLFLLQYYVDWDKDKRMLMKMALVFITSAVMFSLIKIFGYMNNLLVGIAVMILTSLLVWFLGLIQKDDLKMFYLPIKNKIENIFLNKNKI